MSISTKLVSQKDYLKKYLSDETKDRPSKRKKKRKELKAITGKRLTIIDDDIDLKSMRPLDDDEIDLFQMNEEAPQIAGIIDERPAEVKAQEYYNSKRWKVFGGEDGVNVVDSMDNNKQSESDKPKLDKNDFDSNQKKIPKEKIVQKSGSTESDNSPIRSKSNRSSSQKSDCHNKTIVKSKSIEVHKKMESSRHDDSDLSPPRSDIQARERYSSDPSPPRRGHLRKHSQDNSDSDVSVPRSKYKQKRDKPEACLLIEKEHKKREKYNSDSDFSPPRKEKRNTPNYERDYDNSSPRKEKGNKSHYERGSDSRGPSRQGKGDGTFNERDRDNSPPRKEKRSAPNYERDYDNSSPRKEKGNKSHYERESDNRGQSRQGKGDGPFNERDRDSPPRRKKDSFHRHKSDSDNFPPRVKIITERVDKLHSKYNMPDNKDLAKRMKRSPSDSDNSPPRKDDKSKSKRDLTYKKISRRNYSDSDASPPRKKKNSFGDESSSDLSPPRKINENKPQKKKLYKPNDSSSDEDSNSKSKKMKKTLDGKQAGLQDAKQLKKELSDLRMKEDLMFAKMDASVSGVGAAAIKRDRKTGQIRDLEKEKEIQKEKDAKASVVNEKYSRWGKGLKQVEDAKERAAEALKEMSKPLARYADDEDLDNFLKAQEREGDPMLDYIKQKQNEATPLVGVKPKYQGPCNPNRFGIRPGHRWDGVVRSNGFEKEWFTNQNARKARDEEAYKWSTSDM